MMVIAATSPFRSCCRTQFPGCSCRPWLYSCCHSTFLRVGEFGRWLVFLGMGERGRGKGVVDGVVGRVGVAGCGRCGCCEVVGGDGAVH